MSLVIDSDTRNSISVRKENEGYSFTAIKTSCTISS